MTLSAVVLAMAVGFASACGTDGSPTASSPQEELEAPGRRAATLVGYAPVNHWQDIDARDLARLLWSHGLTATGIEYVPWFQPKTVDCPEKLGGGAGIATDVEAAREFVEAMRDFGIVTWINVVNANGCAQRAQGDDWFDARLDEIRERIGTERVLFQAVSEPWVVEEDDDRDKMFRWTRHARDHWDGLFSIPGVGQGEHEPHWSILHDVVDVHHCHDEELVEHLRDGDDSLFLNTDCRTIANPGPERAARFTDEALEAGSNLLIYGFWDEGIDREVIEAMGRVVAEKGEEVTPTPTATATETPVPTATPTPTPTPSPTPTSGLPLPLL